MEETLRRLVIRAYHAKNVIFADKTKIVDDTLFINKDAANEIVAREKLVKQMSIEIIKPNEWDKEINTIMDVIPISTKVLGSLGEGITHTLTGVYVVLCGSDEDGRQMHEFGCSAGILSEQLFSGRAGTPSKSDYIIHIDVKLQGGLPFDRNLPNAAFKVCDEFIQTIREPFKTLDHREFKEVHEFFDKVHRGRKRVALVKQVAGQGAMYDNLLFPNEPSGFEGGISIINMMNVPIILSPNEYRDGALRSMT